MKKFILLKLIPFIAVCVANSVFAQDSGFIQTERDEMGYIPAPQTWAFMRYGNTPVDYYTGTAQVNVPLYEYKDNDFNISVSAGYASNGLVPQRQTGILGLNWFLNCGGAITREIRGLPDDKNVTGLDAIFGFLVGSQKEYNDDDLLHLRIGGLPGDPDYWTDYVVNGTETESDIFHFNFMGHSGSFHFDGHRNIKVYNTNGNHGTYKIEYRKESTGTEIEEITIKTADGYTYVFGNNKSSKYEDDRYVERSLVGTLVAPGHYRLSKGVGSLNLVHQPIVTWLLREIVAPNQRKVVFNYNSQTYSEQIFNQHCNPYYTTSFSFGYNKVPDYDGSNTSTDHCRRVSVVKTSNLSQIRICNDKNGDSQHDIIIDFYYSEKPCRDATVVSSTDNDHAKADANIAQYTLKLDALSVTGSGNNLRTCSFGYRNKDTRLILNSISVSGIGVYKMSYFEQYSFPEISTADIDFWGYYNGKGNKSDNITSTTTIGTNGYDEIIEPGNESHHPDWKYSILGCLKRIEYPTKGYTEFEYEPNRAHYIVRKCSESAHPESIPVYPVDTIFLGGNGQSRAYLAKLDTYSSLFGSVDETGGVRVRRIIDYNGSGGYQTREFSYSNGIVSYFPRFWTNSVYLNRMTGDGYLYYDSKHDQYGRLFNCINNNVTIRVNTFDKSHIGYSSVVERFSDGASVEYCFNDYRSHPDEYKGQCRTSLSFPGSGKLYDTVFLNNITRVPNSRHYQRGKLNKTTYFDKNNRKVKCEYCKYADHNADDSDNYSAFVLLCGETKCSAKIYTGDYRLTEKSVTEYFGTDSITTRTSFEYNEFGQTCRISVYMPDDNIVSDNTNYLHEIVDSLKQYNFYDFPYRKYRMVEDNTGNRYITSATEISYLRTDYTNPSMVKPELVKEAEIGDPVPWSKFSNIFPSLNYKTKISYEDYDSKGNPTQLVDEYGVRTSYVWGYEGLYPVVKAVNVKREVLNTKLGITAHEPLQDGLSDPNENDNFPLFDIDGALINLYYYEPHVGMTKYCDPTRRWTYFSYDAFGRLSMKWDDVGAVETYEYHIE